MGLIISGTGSYIPEIVVSNQDFGNHQFLNEDGSPFQSSNVEIAQKFEEITGIKERRYVSSNLRTSDIAFLAAEKAISHANIDREEIDYIIFAHNFGDITEGSVQSEMLPSLASRLKHALRIKNPKCVAYDLLFGCPGWIEGMIHATAFIKAGIAKRCLVIGAETLSRTVDKSDRDSMIYSDGAGATIIEYQADATNGFISHESATYSYDEAYFLYNGESYDKSRSDHKKYLKMHGRKIYEFALKYVPQAMLNCIVKANIDVSIIKKILIHQANEKMDEAIINRFYKLCNFPAPKDVMPMSIHKLGNSSVATIPTLFDLLIHRKIENHLLGEGDILLFASVGAGMNINAFLYEF